MPILNPVGDVGAAETRLLYLAVSVMAAIVVPVIVVTLFFAWRYRDGARDDLYDPTFEESPVIHHVTLFVPLLTIAVLGGLTWIYTHKLDPYRPRGDANATPYEIQAISLDFKWVFIYPEEGIATVNELVAPTDRPVTLRMTSDPMMTAIFIPGLISQIYTMPGMETRANFLASKEGILQGANAMYSGAGFETQRFKTHLVSPEKFTAWVTAVRAGTAPDGKAEPKLDWDRFEELVNMSTGDPVTRFASIEQDIFPKDVRKYMPDYEMRPLPTAAEYMAKTDGTAHAGHMAATTDKGSE